ncbi:voltage-dependent calcium channel beta subunit-associated regulatory protein isoform X2 [Denticeps clupeoides]|uniref:voltage-dependent calcium channel beta subunit-associated regulatory protein isoform X2 n=1 Tax=Denticeps clupeoides TaxID=299321 RepID=UPI0010A51C26|nr:voltage-dependent calcium channel beta subunit-associated regulatory protein-like isoform X2 [Denticeps clupeoides]
MEETTDQGLPVASDRQENYVLLLVLLCVFAGGTLVLLSILLIFCHRCCPGGRRYSRASDDLEKTNTTYVEEAQLSQDITIRLERSDSLSASGCHGDTETERFLSTASTGRRVSFNEQAIYEQGKKGQEKVRRYTLTEGDFHHLKRARLTHLHITPPALKILTIMECQSSETSICLSEQTSSKPSLSIFQPVEEGLNWTPPSPSGGLPGDTFNSVLDTSVSERPVELPRSQTMEAIGERGWNGGGPQPEDTQEPPLALAVVTADTCQETVLHFFTKLRRHTSLEGASPYFKIKRWKMDMSQRATSLDLRGSPKRRAFQRQRAASETLDHEEVEPPTVESSVLRSTPIPAPPPQADTCPRHLSVGFLSADTMALPSLGRLEVEAVMEVSSHAEPSVLEPSPDLPQLHVGQEKKEANGAEVRADEEGEEVAGGEVAGAVAAVGGWRSTVAQQDGLDQPTLYRDIWSLRASLEQYASSDLSSNDRDSTRSDADSISSLGGAAAVKAGAQFFQSQDIDDEVDGDGELPYDEPRPRVEGDKEGRVDRKQGGNQDSVDSERGGSDGETGSRKLLQMDSGYASIEAPCKAPDELRLFGSSGGGKTASERRRFFTSAGRKGTVCESFETRIFKEELEEVEESPRTSAEEMEMEGALQVAGKTLFAPKDQHPSPLPPSPLLQQKPRSRFRRRDYSIDEKTEALFNEFLRHDPQFDQQQESPSLRTRHRSRVHLRKQWQRTKQYSDPGGSAATASGRFSPSLERLRFGPLHRGESANYPLDSRPYHSPLPRIASAADEEASEGATPGGGTDATVPEPEDSKARTPSGGEQKQEQTANNSNNNSSSQVIKCVQLAKKEKILTSISTQDSAVGDCGIVEDCGSEYTVQMNPSDKLVASLEERLYGGLHRTKGSQDCVVAVAQTSPDHGGE